MELNQEYKVLTTACTAGAIMLQSGAEVYRVEQTIERLCCSYGVASIQCSVTPTVITASIQVEGKPLTHMLRAASQQLDLDKVDKINDLSRSVAKHPIPVEELEKRLETIENTKPLHFVLTALAAGAGTGASVLVLGGTITDFASGVVIGFLLRLLMVLLTHYGFQDLFSRFLGGAIGALLSAASVNLGIASQWEIMSVAALTLLFPGLLFTNSLRDVASGDFVSAITHAVEAFSIAAALAGGAGFGAWHTKLHGGIADMMGKILLNCLFASCSSISFSVLFNVRGRKIIWPGVCGAIGYFVYLMLGRGSHIAMFCAGLAITLTAEMVARATKTPATLYLVGGLLPLVPGGEMFRMFLALMYKQNQQTMYHLMNTILYAGALAFGVVAVGAMLHCVGLFKKAGRDKKME